MRKLYFTFFLAFLMVPAVVSGEPKDLKIPKMADVSLSGVFFAEPQTSTNILGKNIKIIDDNVGPNFSACNNDKTEIAKFVMHEGDVKNSFSEFKVKYAEVKDKSAFPVLNGVEQFVSGKNIRLGMSKNGLMEILGIKFTTKREKDVLVLKYKLDDYKRSKFLQHYNLPAYYGEYRFKDGKLIEFAYGFEMP